MRMILISESELDRLRNEMLTRLELDSLQGKPNNHGEPLSYSAVHYHVHRLVEAIKDAK